MLEYDFFFCIINIFGIYVNYKLLRCFLGESIRGKKIHFFSYVIFYLLGTMTYLLFDIPFALIIVNVLGMFGLAFNYSSDIKKNMAAAIYVYVLLIIVEVSVGIATGHLEFGLYIENNYQNIWGLVLNNLLAYLLALVLQNFKNMKQGVKIPRAYWAMIIIVPGASGVVTLALLYGMGEAGAAMSIWALLCILLINVLAVSLYDKLAATMAGEAERVLLGQQNQYYSAQLALMQSAQQHVNVIKHDSKNHIIALGSLLERGEWEEARSHLGEMLRFVQGSKNYSDSGNVLIDSILNFKLTEAEDKQANIRCHASVPEILSFDSFDITCILGNLLDNGVEAMEKAREKTLDVDVKYIKGLLIIQIENSYDGELKEEKGVLKSRKPEAESHGLGLQSVRHALAKYEGSLDLQFTGSKFMATAVLSDKKE